MSRLVQELKNDHASIVDMLTIVSQLGVMTEAGQQKLMAAKTALMAHLKREDDELYPALRQSAEGDPRLKKTLDLFAAEMDQVSQTALAFFEKYSNGSSGGDFAKDFGQLKGALGIRIRREETILYDKYDQLVH